jgi:hypothetical protein
MENSTFPQKHLGPLGGECASELKTGFLEILSSKVHNALGNRVNCPFVSGWKIKRSVSAASCLWAQSGEGEDVLT